MIERLYEFFENNQDLFEEPKNTRENSPHGDIYKILKESGKLHWTWGKCFPISLFLFYTFDGYDGPYDLFLKKNIKIEVHGHKVTTTHWFLKTKKFKEVLDITHEQFDGLVDMKKIYRGSTFGAFGVPFIIKEGIRIDFDNNVPTTMVFRLYERWLKTNEPLPGIHKYYKVWNTPSTLPLF